MSPALLARIATAGVLVPVFVAIVVLAPKPYLQAAFAVVVFLAAFEWAALGHAKPGARWAFALCVCGFLFALRETPAAVYSLILYVSVGFWVFVAICLVQIQRTQRGLSWLRKPSVHLVVGLLILLPAWLAITSLSGKLILVLFCVVWLGDTGAYFCGRAWGRAKLASAISPGKTWAGFWGAVLLGSSSGPIFAWALGLEIRSWPGFVIVCCLTVVISVVGDLTESQFKRVAGVKDSGNLLPGHGGVLDRIDSLTAAAPIFALGVVLIEASS